MNNSSFSKILEGKLADTAFQTTFIPRQEFDTTPAHLAFLLGEIRISPLGTRKNSYPAPPPRAKKPHLLGTVEQKAFDLFHKLDEKLTPAFSKDEVRKAFRRLAKRLHPDHASHSSEASATHFIELREAYRSLQNIPKK